MLSRTKIATAGGCGFALIALLGHATVARAQFGPAPVTVSSVVEGTVASGQTFVGSIMAVRHSIVGSAVDGRVLEFHVNEGDHVRKDQPLAQLRTEALEIQIAGAKADQKLREQELAELKAGSRPEELEQAKSRMLGAKAMMDFRLARYGRMRELVEKRASSADELQDSASAAEFAAQNYVEHKATWNLAVAGPRQEKILQAQARVDVAIEQVHTLEDQLRKHTIISPFDGYVVAEHTEVGQWIARAAPVAEVVEVSEVDVHVMVLETYVPFLHVGMKSRVEVSALPREEIEGEVASIVPQADLRSRSFPVKIRLKNREDDGQPLLKPGMFARVTLPVGKPESALLVPKDALVLGGPSPLIYVVDPPAKGSKDATVRPVPVELGVVHDNMIQVRGAIKIGDSVVSQGNERLRPGQAVTIVSAAGSRAAARQ